ncbi:MAG: hypothetical protein FRX49_04960 [Trebouxia sp. A1-2]|nr:MAG: hypothetical protein FRX49_04960 [Trebouxia sp. A1-2]
MDNGQQTMEHAQQTLEDGGQQFIEDRQHGHMPSPKASFCKRAQMRSLLRQQPGGDTRLWYERDGDKSHATERYLSNEATLVLSTAGQTQAVTPQQDSAWRKRTEREPLSQYSLTSQNSKTWDLALGCDASPSETSSFFALYRLSWLLPENGHLCPNKIKRASERVSKPHRPGPADGLVGDDNVGVDEAISQLSLTQVRRAQLT